MEVLQHVEKRDLTFIETSSRCLLLAVCCLLSPV
jgi:hypothetical protein